MAKKMEQPFNLKPTVAKETTKISNARYGRDVRDAIVKSIDTLADKTSEVLNDYVGDIVNRNNQVTQTAQSIQGLYDTAVVQADKISTIVGDYSDLASSIENFTNIQVETVEWTSEDAGNGNISWTANASLEWIPQTTTITRIDPETGESYEETVNTGYWKWNIPRWPNINNVRWNWVNKQTDPDLYKNHVSYNPTTGILDVYAKDYLSDLTLVAFRRTYTQDPTATLVYSQDADKYTLRLGLSEGPAGAGATAANYRPFYYTLYEADESVYRQKQSNRPKFYKGTLFESTTVFVDPEDITNSQIEKLGNFYANDSVFNDLFDGVYVTFRKSVDNNVENATEHKLNNNFGTSSTAINTKLLDKNDDYDSTVTVYVPKGQSVFATYTDKYNRTFGRRVYFINETMYEIVGGLSSNIASRDRFITESEYNRLDGNDTFDIVQTFDPKQNMLVFENAVQCASTPKGNVGDWAAAKDGVVDDNDQPIKYSHSTDLNIVKSSPVGKLNTNYQYDQFMIPILVTGVIFKMPESISTRLVGQIH